MKSARVTEATSNSSRIAGKMDAPGNASSVSFRQACVKAAGDTRYRRGPYIEVLSEKSGAARVFGETFKATLKEAMAFLHDFRSGKTRGYRSCARELKEEISYQLALGR